MLCNKHEIPLVAQWYSIITKRTPGWTACSSVDLKTGRTINEPGQQPNNYNIECYNIECIPALLINTWPVHVLIAVILLCKPVGVRLTGVVGVIEHVFYIGYVISLNVLGVPQLTPLV